MTPCINDHKQVGDFLNFEASSLAGMCESLEHITWKYRLEAVTVIGANLVAAARALPHTGWWVSEGVRIAADGRKGALQAAET